ncbi:hypothetical protein BGZ60DRAFT_422301 [Tricladium varicosporioides]|nr:hypothetical protein BGZ60DRAFT_422301 [Hymenoscyphus varicosporioides]
MGPTQFKVHTTVLRASAGILAATGMALYVIILAKVTDERFPATAIGLTALPLSAAAGSVLWNILAMATMTILKPIWHAIGDSLLALTLAVLGSIGFYHDSHTYLQNAMYKVYDDDAWLSQEIAAGCLLLLSLLLQFLLVLFNVAENRHLQRAKSSGPPPTYIYRSGSCAVDKKGTDVETDWKSIVSFESSANTIEKPEAIKV